MKNIVKSQKRNKKIQENKCLSCIYREEDICIKRDINIYNKDNEYCVFYYKAKPKRFHISSAIIGVISSLLIFRLFRKKKMKKIIYIFTLFLLYNNNIYAKPIDLTGTIPYYIEENDNVYAVNIGNYIMDIYGNKDDFVIYDYSDYQNLTEADKLKLMQKIIGKIPNCIYFPAYNNKQTDILGTYIDKNQIDYIDISDSKNYYWNATIHTKQNRIIYTIFDDKRRIELSKILKINIIVI